MKLVLQEQHGPGFYASNLSDKELLVFAEANFKNPTPLLQRIISRLEFHAHKTPTEVLATEQGEESDGKVENAVCRCPGCGSTLLVCED